MCLCFKLIAAKKLKTFFSIQTIIFMQRIAIKIFHFQFKKIKSQLKFYVKLRPAGPVMKFRMGFDLVAAVKG